MFRGGGPLTLPLPVQATVTPGETITSAMSNSNIRDAVNYLLAVPFAVAYQGTSTTSMAGSAWVTVGFDTTGVDTYGMHSNTVNSSRLTCELAGWYEFSGCVAWPSGTGNKWSRIMKNGSVVIGGSSNQSAGSASDVSCTPTKTTKVQMSVGDWVELQGAQFTGGTITTRIGADGGVSMLEAFWLHT
jgi:hypothetical protein